MALDEERWRRLYNLFDPTLRLELQDHDLFVRRPGAVAEEIADDLSLGLEPDGKWVVCGSTGSGKSSELVHLGGLLHASHLVVGLDLPGSVARVDQLQPAEVLFLVGAAVVRVAKDDWAFEVDPGLTSELLSAFRGLLSSEGHNVDIGKLLSGVALFAANLAAPGTGAVAGAASGAATTATGAIGDRARVSLRSGAKLGGLTKPSKEGEPDFERLRQAVDAVLDAVRQKRPPVILVDGLDKLLELSTIRDLFATNRILALPRAQVVYTGPITLMLATEWQAAGGAFKRQRLTNVVSRRPELTRIDISDETVDAGRRALAEVVARRLQRLDLKISDVFEPGGLEALTEASGGLLRDLIHLVNRGIRWTLRNERGRLGKRAVRAAIEEVSKEYEITLNTLRVEELMHVRKHGEPSGAERANDLLLDGYVLPYSNGRVWFEPHPILRGLRPGL